jgi:flavin-dependent dehydrogenase
LKALGISTATSAAFFAAGTEAPARPLTEPALCLSRFALDHWLAQEFQRLGGELRPGERWAGDFGEGIVRASGRRAEPTADGWRLFGLKVHARDVPLTADLEMHFGPGGYVGLCRLPGGETNICGLFRSAAAVPDLATRWRDWLGGVPGSVLQARLAKARFDETSFCSIAGISLRPRRALQQPEACVGDSLTMIPPVTGNGMSMAFESAELAVGPLLRFSRGELEWPPARAEVARACDAPTRAALLFLAARSDGLWRGLFGRTR